MVRLFFVALALVLLSVSGGRQVSAQEASPVAAPAVCDSEPRAAEDLLAIWYDESGTQISLATPEASGTDGDSVVIPIGELADEQTIAGVTAAAEEIFACFSAGEFLRAYGLFTDDLIASFGPEPGTPIEDAEAFLSMSPGEMTEDESGDSQIIAVTNVMVYDDGRVGGFFVDSTDGVESTAFVFFEQVDGSWLADEVIEFPSPFDEE